jgi:hypothetical protein
VTRRCTLLYLHLNLARNGTFDVRFGGSFPFERACLAGAFRLGRVGGCEPKWCLPGCWILPLREVCGSQAGNQLSQRLPWMIRQFYRPLPFRPIPSHLTLPLRQLPTLICCENFSFVRAARATTEYCIHTSSKRRIQVPAAWLSSWLWTHRPELLDRLTGSTRLRDGQKQGRRASSGLRTLYSVRVKPRQRSSPHEVWL